MKTIHFISIMILILPGIGCSPAKRLERLIALHPELVKVDTMHIRDTFAFPQVIADTTFSIASLREPVVIEKDRLQIELQTINDTIIVHGECKADTVFREKLVPVEKIVKGNTGIMDSLTRYVNWKLLVLAVVLTGIIIALRKLAR